MANEFPLIKSLGLEVISGFQNAREYSDNGTLCYHIDSLPTPAVRAADVEALLAKGVRVRNEGRCKIWKEPGLEHANDTHSALLIAIEPIRKETAEDILRELIAHATASDWTVFGKEFLERAKRVLDQDAIKG